MDIRADEISKLIRDQLGSHSVEIDVAEVGSVISVGVSRGPSPMSISRCCLPD